MKNKILLSLLIIAVSIFSSYSAFSNENSSINQSEENNLREKIEINGNQIIVNGGISFPDNSSIQYDFHVKGDLKIGSNVKLLGNIIVDGDILIGNNVTSHKILAGNNITVGSYFIGETIKTKANLEFHGFAKIQQGLYVGGDLDSGGDMLLQGNSKIMGDVTLGKDVTISGIFYVYGNMRGNYDFLFQGDKIRIVGDFTTQMSSKLVGKIYMFADTGHRTLYGNRTIRYRYESSNTQYKGVMKEIDPVLDYRFSQNHIDIIHDEVLLFEAKITDQKEVIERKYNGGKSELILDREINKLISLQKEMFEYVSQYIENENWDSRQWKIIQFQEKRKLKTFIYQFVTGDRFDY